MDTILKSLIQSFSTPLDRIRFILTPPEKRQ